MSAAGKKLGWRRLMATGAVALAATVAAGAGGQVVAQAAVVHADGIQGTGHQSDGIQGSG